MKRVESVVEVPAAQRIEVVYVCEVADCGFETGDEQESRRHRGLTHAVRAEREIGGTTFLRFVDEVDFEIFKEVADDQIDHVRGDWSGAGWYARERSSERRGCGCCWDETLTLTTAAKLASDWRRRAATLLLEADQLDAMSASIKSS